MSVRRLGLVQPASFAFNAENLAWAKKTITNYPPGKQASAVIALLWRAQEQNEGWISKPAMEHVGNMLDMAFIRVYEIATFYTMFQLSPVGRKAHVQVCGTTPCMLRGAEDLKKVCQRKIHHDPHHVSADGNFSWEEVECLGACVNAPMVQIWKDTYEDLTPASLEAVLDGFASGNLPKPGPQVDRQLSAPQGGLTSLTDKSLYAKERVFKRVEAAPPPAAAAVVAPVAKAPEPVKLVEALPETKPKAAPKAKAAPKPKADPAGPELMEKPRGGKRDDLKLIWGVGPALEKMLNKMGVFHFDQIAAWTKSEIKWVDERLEGFKGRATRDKWIAQSKKLAKGWRPAKGVGERPE